MPFVKLKKPMTGYKKVYTSLVSGWRQVVLEVVIPRGATVYFKRGEPKRRATSATPVKATLLWSPDMPFRVFFSSYSNSFKYRIGEEAMPRNGFSRLPLTCAPGIHFFRSYGQARDYGR